MFDPSLFAAQQSAKAAWASFWGALVLGSLGVVVNGAIAWLAFDGPRRQRKADQDIAVQTLAHEAGKIINLQLGGLNVCVAVYLTVDEIVQICQDKAPQGVIEMHGSLLPTLEMNRRLIDYFLSKDISDASVIHIMMKTKDAAENLIGALKRPGLLSGDLRQTYADIGLVGNHVLEQCKHERLNALKRIEAGSAFIDRLAGA